MFTEVPMPVLDVYVNDRSCAAPVSDAMVSSPPSSIGVKLTGPAAESAHGFRPPGEEARLHVGGLRRDTHLSWAKTAP
jgi:hypothetical protein